VENPEDDKTVKLSVKGIGLIRKPAESYIYKIDALLRDHYNTNNLLCTEDLVTLMELRISSQILVSYLSELCFQAEEAEVSYLHLYPEEVTMIAKLAKGLYAAVNTQMGNLNLLEN
jgi:hypothetical protein